MQLDFFKLLNLKPERNFYRQKSCFNKRKKIIIKMAISGKRENENFHYPTRDFYKRILHAI